MLKIYSIDENVYLIEGQNANGAFVIAILQHFLINIHDLTMPLGTTYCRKEQYTNG